MDFSENMDEACYRWWLKMRRAYNRFRYVCLNVAIKGNGLRADGWEYPVERPKMGKFYEKATAVSGCDKLSHPCSVQCLHWTALQPGTGMPSSRRQTPIELCWWRLTCSLVSFLYWPRFLHPFKGGFLSFQGECYFSLKQWPILLGNVIFLMSTNKVC